MTAGRPAQRKVTGEVARVGKGEDQGEGREEGHALMGVGVPARWGRCIQVVQRRQGRPWMTAGRPEQSKVRSRRLATERIRGLGHEEGHALVWGLSAG
jgi:hypothetical protein